MTSEARHFAPNVKGTAAVKATVPFDMVSGWK
jgi:outer membrane usher protein FimD/PapC